MIKLGVISPFYSPEGISDYSEQLYLPISQKDAFNLSIFANKDVTERTGEDKEFVYRTWNKGETDFSETVRKIIDIGISICHIQYHSDAFFPIEGLDNLIDKLIDNDIKVLVTLHAVKGRDFNVIKSSKSLSKVESIFIHNKIDFEGARSKLSNVRFFEHPRVRFKDRDKLSVRNSLGLDSSDPIIATHGIFNTNKNILTLIESIKILKDQYPHILLISLTAVVKNNVFGMAEYEMAKKYITENGLESNVIIFDEFLDIEQIILLLQASDLAVLAYSEFGESASGAISKCLGAGVPTIVSNVKAFSEFNDEVYRLESLSPSGIAKSIKEVLNDESLIKSMKVSAQTYIEQNTFEKKAAELLEIYRSIQSAK